MEEADYGRVELRIDKTFYRIYAHAILNESRFLRGETLRNDNKN